MYTDLPYANPLRNAVRKRLHARKIILSRAPISFPDNEVDECSMSGYEREIRRSIHQLSSTAPLNPTEQIGQGPDKVCKP